MYLTGSVSRLQEEVFKIRFPRRNGARVLFDSNGERSGLSYSAAEKND